MERSTFQKESVRKTWFRALCFFAGLTFLIPTRANMTLEDSGEIRFHDDAGSEYISFKAPDSLAGTVNSRRFPFRRCAR